MFGLSRSILFLAFINFSLAVASTISYAISPYLSVDTLGMSGVLFGFLEGFSEFLANCLKLGSGIIIDQFQKIHKVLRLGIIFSWIARPLMLASCFFSSAFLLLSSKIFERLSNGIVATARDVLVCRWSTTNNRARVYSWMMISKNAGCIVGPGIVWFLSWWDKTYFETNFHLFIFLALGFATAAIVASLSSYSQDLQPEIKESGPQTFKWAHVPLLGKGIGMVLLCSVFFMLGRFNDGVLALYGRDEAKAISHITGYSLIGIFNTFSALSAWPVGWLLDQKKEKALLFAAIISLIACDICLIYSGQNNIIFMIAMAFWGFQRSTSQIVFVSMLSHITPRHLLGTGIGLFYILSGLATFGASLIMGYIVDLWGGYTGGFWASIIACLLALVFFPYQFKRKQVVVERPSDKV